MASSEEVSKQIKGILESPFWLGEIKSNIVYQTEDDDSPPNEAWLQVVFSGDGDAWVAKITDSPIKSIRKRTYAGGGRDHRTRQALMILAYAMKLDAEGEYQCI